MKLITFEFAALIFATAAYLVSPSGFLMWSMAILGVGLVLQFACLLGASMLLAYMRNNQAEALRMIKGEKK